MSGALRSAGVAGRTHVLAAHLCRRSGLSSILLIAFVALLCAGIRDIEFSADARKLLPENSRDLVDIERLVADYDLRPSILLMVEPADGDRFSAATFQVVSEMTGKIAELPGVISTLSLATYPIISGTRDELEIEPVLSADDRISDAEAENAARIVLEGALPAVLAAPDGTAYGVYGLFEAAQIDPAALLHISDAAYALLQQLEAAHPDHRFYLTGDIIGGALFNEVARDDLMRLVPIALLISAILLGVGLGSVRALLATSFVAIAGTLTAIGFAGWTGFGLTPATAASPLAVLVVINASCIHLCLGWKRALATGCDPADAVLRSVSQNLVPVTLANLTTASGFLMLHFLGSPGMREIGYIVAIGVVSGWLLAFAVIPFALSFGPDLNLAYPWRLDRTIARIVAFAMRSRCSIVAVSVAVSVVSVVAALHIAVDDNLVRYFDERYEFRRDSERVQEKLTGLDRVFFSVPAPARGGIFDPTFLAQVDAFATWLRGQQDVVEVFSVVDLIRSMDQFLRGENALPMVLQDPRASAQYVFLYEISDGDRSGIDSLISRDRSRILVSLDFRNRTSDDLRDLVSRSERWLRDNTPEIATRAVGASVAFARVSQFNTLSMIIGACVMLVLVSLLLAFVLRSFGYGLISLVPNLLPIILSFGLWGMSVNTVNLGAVIVLTMSFGIIVDDTIHIMTRYVGLRRSGDLAEAAVARALSLSGLPIVLTTLGLIIGFLVMGASGFQINQQIGLLTALIMATALAADLVLLPALLSLAEGRRR